MNSLKIYDNLAPLAQLIYDNVSMNGETTDVTLNTTEMAQSVYYLIGKVNNELISLKLIKI